MKVAMLANPAPAGCRVDDHLHPACFVNVYMRCQRGWRANDVDHPLRAFQEGPVTPAHRLLRSPRAGVNMRWEVSGSTGTPRHLLCFILLFYPVRSSRHAWMLVLSDAAGLRDVSELVHGRVVSCNVREARGV